MLMHAVRLELRELGALAEGDSPSYCPAFLFLRTT